MKQMKLSKNFFDSVLQKYQLQLQKIDLKRGRSYIDSPERLKL